MVENVMFLMWPIECLSLKCAKLLSILYGDLKPYYISKEYNNFVMILGIGRGRGTSIQ